jgi:hypothetical protein
MDDAAADPPPPRSQGAGEPTARRSRIPSHEWQSLAGDWRQTGRRPPSGPRRVRFAIMVRQAAARDMTDSEIIDGLRDAAVDQENGRLVHCETEDDLRTFFSTLRTDEG